MPYRLTPFETNYCYHIFNRGVEKRIVFLDIRDYQRFLQTLYYYQFQGPKPKFSNKNRFTVKDFSQNPKIIDIICYCLMPNHFHLLIKQLKDGGVKEFIQKVINSYTKYFNIKHTRVGHLFQGMSKAVFVESDEQLLHLSRYIHLNPYVSDLTDKPEDYFYSSYPAYTGNISDPLVAKELILDSFPSPAKYKECIDDHAGYAQELEYFKHLLIDID